MTASVAPVLRGDRLERAGGVLARLGRGVIGCDGVEGCPGLDVEWSATPLAGQPVWELALTVTNVSDSVVEIDRFDPLDLSLTDPTWSTQWFSSSWGEEFDARSSEVAAGLILETRSGRSSHGTHPWLGMTSELADAALIVAPAWSGNWHITVEGSGRVTAGVSSWRMRVALAPGERLRAPRVVLAGGVDLDGASIALQRAVRDGVLARTSFTDSAPTEWNHWWPYEDVDVDERVVLDNTRLAVDAGLETVVVDAGWFGRADADSDWQHQRGDWASENTARFPAGLARLGDDVRAAGALMGAWIEPEAVGRDAVARSTLVEAVALGDPDAAFPGAITVSLDPADPAFLGYVCLGSAAGRRHALDCIDDLVRRTGARWIKLDFNVDPGAGCRRTDHGHGAGDGLLRHYEGLYAVLDEVRSRHPGVLLEACSSGGLRIDLGLARHVHAFFLSDLDHTAHHLRMLAGAARMLPPLGILHWSHSQWRGDHPAQQLDWGTLGADRFDAMLRAAMLHRFGVSLALPTLPTALRDRLARHVSVFRDVVAPLLRRSVLRVASPSEATTVLQLTDEEADTHVVAMISDDAAVSRLLVPHLDPARRYRVEDPFSGAIGHHGGAHLAGTGIALGCEGEDCSWLMVLRPAEGDR